MIRGPDRQFAHESYLHAICQTGSGQHFILLVLLLLRRHVGWPAHQHERSELNRRRRAISARRHAAVAQDETIAATPDRSRHEQEESATTVGDKDP